MQIAKWGIYVFVLVRGNEVSSETVEINLIILRVFRSWTPGHSIVQRIVNVNVFVCEGKAVLPKQKTLG